MRLFGHFKDEHFLPIDPVMRIDNAGSNNYGGCGGPPRKNELLAEFYQPTFPFFLLNDGSRLSSSLLFLKMELHL